MIMGSLCGQLYFNSPLLIGTCDRVELRDCIFDQIKIDEALIAWAKKKIEWSYDTIMLGEFMLNSMEAGNIQNKGLKTKFLKLKKRRKDEMTWQDIKIFPYEMTKVRYEHKDRLVESYEEYEYAAQPISYGGILGQENIEEITAEFEGVWILGDKTEFNVKYNDEIEQVTTNVSGNVIQTLGSKYPFIIKNGAINYREFTVKGMLLAKETEDAMGQINHVAEKKYRQKLMEFLTDSKPKIVKDSSGNYILAQIVEAPTLIPSKDLYRQLYDISFKVVEVADAYDQYTLLKYGLLDKKDLLTDTQIN